VNLFRALLLSVAIATATSPVTTYAQTAAALVEQGIRAYDELEFEAAAASLRRALRAVPGVDIGGEAYARALIYLAATQYYRDDPDSTEALFEQLVLFDTRQRPDPLVFEPGVTDIFEAVRRDTKALTVVVPDRTAIGIGAGDLPVTLYASSFIGTVVEIFDQDSSLTRLVYDGPVSDSLVVTWDGLDSTGTRPPDGNYTLAITSRRPGGAALRSTRFPLNLFTTQRDTLAHPLPQADSLFLPERTGRGQTIETLLGGLLMGGAVMVLPGAMASESELMGTRIAVGGAMSIAGIVGFVTRRPGRVLPENVAANNAIREEWDERLRATVAENATRVASIRLVVEAGQPQIVQLRRP
jgi:hypothetical protein